MGTAVDHEAGAPSSHVPDALRLSYLAFTMSAAGTVFRWRGSRSGLRKFKRVVQDHRLRHRGVGFQPGSA